MNRQIISKKIIYTVFSHLAERKAEVHGDFLTFWRYYIKYLCMGGAIQFKENQQNDSISIIIIQVRIWFQRYSKPNDYHTRVQLRQLGLRMGLQNFDQQNFKAKQMTQNIGLSSITKHYNKENLKHLVKKCASSKYCKEFLLLFLSQQCVAKINFICNGYNCMLTISELNHVIKYYAYQVQQRIDDLDRLQCLSPTQDQSSQPELLSIVSKYHNYVTKDVKQNKLACKLVERVLQIFDFFKTKSKNQNLLTMIYQKIQAELSCIIEKRQINVGQLLSYIRIIAKPGGIIKVPAEKRRILVKSIVKQQNKIEQKISPTFSLHNIQKRRNNLINPNKHIKTMSLSLQKWKIDEILNGIWNCLELQRIHLVRVKEGNQQQTFKQMLRRNEKNLQNIKQYEKRCRFGVTLASEYSVDTTILSEMKSNIRNTWTSKRKKISFGRKKNQIMKENMSIII